MYYLRTFSKSSSLKLLPAPHHPLSSSSSSSPPSKSHFFNTMTKRLLNSIKISNLFDFLSEEIMFMILDLLHGEKKSFSLVCKLFYLTECKHRREIKPLREENLHGIFKRYPNITHVDLTYCPRVHDGSLAVIANSCNQTLCSIDLSKLRVNLSSGLLSLALNCKNLVEIDLSNAVALRDSAVAAIAEAKKLEKLWLVRCKLITDIGIGCIAVGCKKLRFLSLKWCLGVGDIGVELVAAKCKEIRYLDLSYLPITNECLPSILRLQCLEDLILEGCFGIDDDNLDDIELRCKSLKTVDMSSCQNITSRGLSFIISQAESLQQLTLAYGSLVTVSLVDSFSSLSMLQCIRLDGCLVTCDGLKAIASLPISLKELSLSKCSGVTDDGLSFLVKKHKGLRKLDITCCRKITYVSVAHITHSCTNLVSLRMESCTLIPKEAFVLIGKLHHFLEELDVTDNEIADEGLKSVAGCSNLSVLKLGLCLNVTDAGLAHVGMHCSKLRNIDLYRSAGVTDLGILAIARGCPNLERISVAYCKDITDLSLLSLSKCSRLNTFETRGCPLITSSGLAAIAVGCKQLTRLDVKKCFSIDDSGMLPLAHSSQNLRQINLSYSSVTDTGLLILASIRCLQSLTILHCEGLSPSGLAAALIACGGLTKVKLHASFKQLLPKLLLDHLEARGCVFEWRDKVFQAELDPICWKLQLEDFVH